MLHYNSKYKKGVIISMQRIKIINIFVLTIVNKKRE